MWSLMPTRMMNLQAAYAGLKQGFPPLVGYVAGTGLLPAGATDDPGIYYFIPTLAVKFNLTVEQATVFFLNGMMLLGLLLGLLGSVLAFSDKFSRIAAFVWFTFLAMTCYKHGDVYVISALIVSVVAPWHLLILKKWPSLMVMFFLYVSFGILCGFSDAIRSGSALPILVLVIMSSCLDWRKWSVITVALLLGYLSIAVIKINVVRERDRFIQQQASVLQKIDGSKEAHTATHHPFWHSVYIGLGYLPNNPVGIQYLDESGLQHLRAIDLQVEYLSERYNELAKEAVLDFIKNYPVFFIKTLLVKITAILKKMGVLISLIILLRWYYPRSWKLVDTAFLSALGISMLPGLITVPKTTYLLGLIALSGLYVLFTIEHSRTSIER